MITFHKDGTLPTEPNAIFVFGSNLAGRHGAGAAKVALDRFGAVYRKPRGLYGNSYALPTKDEELRTLPPRAITMEVGHFINFVVNRTVAIPSENSVFPHSRLWFITRVGCGLAGYRDEQIAPLFSPFLGYINQPHVLKNNLLRLSFAEEWRPWLDQRG